MPAAAKALSLKEEVQEMKDAFAERRVLMHQAFRPPARICRPPELEGGGAFYILCDITRTDRTSNSLTKPSNTHRFR